MNTRHVYAVTTDEYWRNMLSEVEDETFRIETVYCPEGYPNCLENLPDADPAALLLLDATGLPDVGVMVRRLRQRGWRYIVVVAADPSAHEARAMFKAGGYDYWAKTSDASVARRQVQECLREIGQAPW